MWHACDVVFAQLLFQNSGWAGSIEIGPENNNQNEDRLFLLLFFFSFSTAGPNVSELSTSLFVRC